MEETLADVLKCRSQTTSEATRLASCANNTCLADGWRRAAPSGYEHLNLAKVDPHAIGEIQRLFRQQLFPVYLFGAAGRGKSFLVAAIHVTISQHPVFRSFSNLMAKFMGNNPSARYDEWTIVKNAAVLIVDEIGIGSSNEWRNENFWNLLEVRRDKPTVFTSNLKPKELAKHFDDRIASRLLAGSLVEMEGPDLRCQWISDANEREWRVVKIGSNQ